MSASNLVDAYLAAVTEACREYRDSLSPVSREAEREDDSAPETKPAEGEVDPDTYRPCWGGVTNPEDAREEQAPIPAEVAQRMMHTSEDAASDALVAMPIVGVGKMGAPEPHSVDDDPMTSAFFAAAERHDGRFELEAMVMLASISRRELPAMTPRLIERRSKLRVVVSGLMGVALLIALAAGLKTIASDSMSTSLRELSEVNSRVVRDAQAAPAARAIPVVPAPSAAAPAGQAEALIESARTTAGEQSEDYRTLMKRAYRLHNMGDYRGTEGAAEAAASADRTNANAYLLWGTALMDQGRVREARHVFGECAKNATQGPVSECKYFR